MSKLLSAALLSVALALPGAARAASLAPPGGVPDYLGDPNWANSPQLRKFVDDLPGLGFANRNLLGQYLPVAVPDTTRYPGSDYYEIELGQYTEQMHSDLPPTTLRGYRQTNTTDPTVSAFHYLGPVIVAERNRPVRIKFTNNLPTGEAGKLFVPVDTTVMGAGEGPEGGLFTENRASVHLHGGRTPWISDGTPHQWITPAAEVTPYKQGVSYANVPDMEDPGPGSMTYYYTNQQSARLMFYHDHAVGITRLNVYVGQAAGYIITDEFERALVNGTTVDNVVKPPVLPAEQIPLIIQDKTFVDADQVRVTDPTWNWGTGPLVGAVRTPVEGDLWYPHVYVPAQNPYDLGGANPYGRWHYGPWFWPPTDVTVGPQQNPYYVGNEDWQAPEMPGAPNPSMPGESFFDVPVINGTVFPKLTVQPRPYRFRILNAANDRFWNLQLYVAADKNSPTVEPGTDAVLCDGVNAVPVADCTEVKMVPAAVGAGLPENWPADGRDGGLPDPLTAGPDFIQIGSEGGFLPRPVVIPQQPVAWNRDPTTFNAGNVTDHALLLGPAERADVVIDFSAYRGKTLILYNDAPAAFPARDARYDYYTGAPDLRETGGFGTDVSGQPTGPLPGMGPNMRTLMQIHVDANGTPQAFDLQALEAAFTPPTPADSYFASGSGLFEAGQEPIIVGQAAYDAAYGMTFPVRWPYWGVSRITDSTIGFMTVGGQQLTVDMEPKAMQDEMGEAFDLTYGRMSGKLGLELPRTNAGNQNFVLQNFDDPPTEIVTASPMGAPVSGDGTQIWKITHNGVDTHPIHFHIFDVQLINRVGWDGAIRLPDENELGWKDTIRISPLEDTIVALRPVLPTMPFGVPDSVRPLNPSMPLGSTEGFTGLDPTTGEALSPPTTNQAYNFGWEYVWHCHILSHEEMDMMRPIVLKVPREFPARPALSLVGDPTDVVNLLWTDGTPAGDLFTLGNPANEVGFRVERAVGNGAFSAIGNALANQTTYADDTVGPGTNYRYRVVAYNAAGEVPSLTVSVTTPGVAPATGVVLSTVLASPQPVGTAVEFTAQGEGAGFYQYRFWLDDGSGWRVVQDYGPTNTWTLDGATAGTFQVAVHVRTSDAVFLEAQDIMTFTIGAVVGPATGVSLTSVPATSPQPVGTPVEFTAAGQGSSNYQYRFWLDDGSGWRIVQDYGPDATWVLDGAVAGTYQVAVHVRTSSAVFLDAQAISSFTIGAVVGPATAVTLTALPASPQPANVTVEFSAAAEGSTNYQYRFWLDDGTGWRVVRDYAPVSTWTMPANTPAGVYQVAVHVRTSTAVFLDVQDIVPYVRTVP